jgi:hypothetical protein
MSSPYVAPPVVKTKSLHCPNCGGPVNLRGFGHALTVICQQCMSVLDATDPQLSVLQQVQIKHRFEPKIPLGTRGKFDNVAWEAIGFQRRTVYDDGEEFTWEEYLLFNPYKGFRYISEYDGHWNFITPLESQPTRLALSRRPAVQMDGHTYKHFSGAEAKTTFVLGEFPWRVKVGEEILCDDFIDPPLVLSSETSPDEVNWSRGVYTPGSEIWKAFALPGSPPPAKGVYLNQPSTVTGSMWGTFFLLLAGLILLAIGFAATSPGDVVFDHAYRFSTADKGEPSLVTPVFELKGRTAGVEVKIDTNLSNNWAYFNLALINEDTGTAFDFGREVSYYYGSDSDGSWNEGSASSTAFVPAVPPGRYYLRIEPEMEAASGRYNGKTSTFANQMTYNITVKHGVMNGSWFWIAAILLFIPPIIHSIRVRSFEVKRWMQSDYPPVKSGGD